MKNLKCCISHCIGNNRPDKSVDGRIWDDDVLKKIKGFGTVMINILEKHDITKVSHLHNLPVSRVTELVDSGISRKPLE